MEGKLEESPAQPSTLCQLPGSSAWLNNGAPPDGFMGVQGAATLSWAQ